MYTGNATTVAQAYAFLATITRDRSVFSASQTLFAVALQKRPTSASYALNLAHVHENVCELKLAVQVIHQFLESNPKLRIGRNGPDCASLASVLAPVVVLLTTSSKKQASSAASAVNNIEHSVDTLSYVTWHEDNDGGYCAIEEVRRVVSGEPEADIEISTSSITAAIPSSNELNNEKYPYSDSDLDLLALGFTAIKVLYHLGYLSCLPEFYRLLEPARRASQTPIHLTTIRNEHAYYQCIAQVLSLRPRLSLFCPDPAAVSSASLQPTANDLATDSEVVSPIGDAPSWERVHRTLALNPALIYASAASRPIYYCGDSHTIPASWAVLNICGQQRLLVPKLVTGIKQWHLRPKSDFYPKAHFFNTVKHIPDHAEVDTVCCVLCVVGCRSISYSIVSCRMYV